VQERGRGKNDIAKLDSHGCSEGTVEESSGKKLVPKKRGGDPRNNAGEMNY